jgi:hypothetical protein
MILNLKRTYNEYKDIYNIIDYMIDEDPYNRLNTENLLKICLYNKYNEL